MTHLVSNFAGKVARLQLVQYSYIQVYFFFVKCAMPTNELDYK